MASKPKIHEGEILDLENLPILPLRNSVLFPGLIIPLVIGRKKTVELLNTIDGKPVIIGVLTQRDKEINDPLAGDMFTTGTTARIIKIVREREQGIDILVQGIERFKVKEFKQSEPYPTASVEIIPNDEREDVEIEALMRHLKDLTNEVLELIPFVRLRSVVPTETPGAGGSAAIIVAPACRWRVTWLLSRIE